MGSVFRRVAHKNDADVDRDVLEHLGRRGNMFAQGVRALAKSIGGQDEEIVSEACRRLCRRGKLVCEMGQFHVPPRWDL